MKEGLCKVWLLLLSFFSFRNISGKGVFLFNEPPTPNVFAFNEPVFLLPPSCAGSGNVQRKLRHSSEDRHIEQIPSQGRADSASDSPELLGGSTRTDFRKEGTTVGPKEAARDPPRCGDRGEMRSKNCELV